jgi:predicted DCC family thiol-disulfide oxidoreductase YuxK
MFEVFFDGDCPLCLREINLLKRLDRHSRIRFTDIALPEFDPSSVGLTMEELMATIRGRQADGQLVEGVEVFRQLYGAVGLGPLIPLTRLPGVTQLLDVAYRGFARNRLRFTGRCTADSCAVGQVG